MFTGPVGPVEVFFYWPEAVLGNFYWPGAIGSPLASSPAPAELHYIYEFSFWIDTYITIILSTLWHCGQLQPCHVLYCNIWVISCVQAIKRDLLVAYQVDWHSCYDQKWVPPSLLSQKKNRRENGTLARSSGSNCEEMKRNLKTRCDVSRD